MPSLISPPLLQKGSKVAVIAPGYACDKQQLNKGIDLLKSWGLHVQPGQHLYSKWHRFAGKDEERLTDLQQALNHPDLAAIFCARGGYGTTRILHLAHFNQFKAAPKWVIGFSDITALHARLFQMGYQSVHGAMPVVFDTANEPTLQSLKHLLFNGPSQIAVPAHPQNKTGQATGRLFGGNLAILCHLCGTSALPQTKGTILFLEDVDEPLYKIDRMLVQLKQCGMLQQLAGLVVGNFSAFTMADKSFGPDLYEVFHQHLGSANYPVVFGFPVGHEGTNLALACGQEVVLHATDQSVTLNISENEPGP